MCESRGGMPTERRAGSAKDGWMGPMFTATFSGPPDAGEDESSKQVRRADKVIQRSKQQKKHHLYVISGELRGNAKAKHGDGDGWYRALPGRHKPTAKLFMTQREYEMKHSQNIVHFVCSPSPIPDPRRGKEPLRGRKGHQHRHRRDRRQRRRSPEVERRCWRHRKARRWRRQTMRR